MSEKTQYIDEKANSINGFDLLSHFLWRRANFLLKNAPNMQQVDVLDPCAGGGKLLMPANNAYNLVGYEPEYVKFAYLEAALNKKGTNNKAINLPFEEYFSKPNVPYFELAISIPYTDIQIDSNYEKDPYYLKFKNYAYYAIARSLDTLEEGAFGVFAIPRSLMDEKMFEYEIDCITAKADILSIEGFEDYSILTLKKQKA